MYVSLDSSFISTQLLVPNLDGWFDLLFQNIFIFFILWFHLFYGDIYLSFGNSLLASFIEFICFERSPPERSSFGGFELLVISSAILLPIKSPVAFAVFSFPLFKGVFVASIVDFLALSISYWLYLLLRCKFSCMCTHIFNKW